MKNLGTYLTNCSESIETNTDQRSYTWLLLHVRQRYHGFGPGSSTAISSTAVSSSLGSSNPVSSANKYLDFKVRLTSICYFRIDLANFLMIIQPLISSCWVGK